VNAVSKVASDPVMPNMPIFAMSFAAWCEFYALDLRRYFYERFERYLDTDEWLLRCHEIYGLQRIKDLTP
jgi:hypothetical protein